MEIAVDVHSRPRPPKQVNPYSPEDPLTSGVERGRWLFHHLESLLGKNLGRDLADIGCGYGGLSIAWSNEGKSAIAIDRDAANAEIVNERVRQGEATPGTVRAMVASALAIPLPPESVDLALMIGVLEWVAYSDFSRPVDELQVAALREAARILRRGGFLVVGTKNRLFPRYAWSDAQLHRPLFNLLPRAAANRLAKRFLGTEYRGHVYSYPGWKRLLAAAGFTNPDILVPIFNYQFPLFVTRPWQRFRLKGALSRVDPQLSAATRERALRSGGFGRGAWYRLFGRAGLLGLAAGSFLILCRKT